MDNDWIEGIGHQIKGAAKRAVGRMIGDAKMASDGSAEKARGDAQLAAAPGGGQVLGVDADRIKGVGHQLEGAVKQGLGNFIDDPELLAAGLAERAAGKAQNIAGGVRDTARAAATSATAETTAAAQNHAADGAPAMDAAK